VRIAHVAFGALFAVAALLQLNDPDPLRWIAIYAAATTACWFAPAWPRRWAFPAAVCIVAIVWAAALARRVLPDLDLANLLRAKDLARPVIEETRELLGLLLVAAWMAVRALSAAGRR
jgi:hypothetical protein